MSLIQFVSVNCCYTGCGNRQVEGRSMTMNTTLPCNPGKSNELSWKTKVNVVYVDLNKELQARASIKYLLNLSLYARFGNVSLQSTVSTVKATSS